MKKAHFSMKCLGLAAIAASATPVAMAQNTNINQSTATGSFVFSSAWLAAGDLLMASMAPASPATTIVATDDSVGDVTGTPYLTYAAGAMAPVGSIGIDGSNELVNVTSNGGFVLQTPISGSADKGYVVINNLSYDATTNTISADLSGVDLTSKYQLATTREQVFSVGTLSYSTDNGGTWTLINDSAHFVIPNGTAFDLRADGLFILGGNNGTVFSQFEHVLGLQGIGLTTVEAVNTYDAATNTQGFGSWTVAQLVPESSTYTFLGLGLIGLGAVSIRAKLHKK